MQPQVRHLMNRDPVTIDQTYTVRETAQMMIDFGIDTLIVTDLDQILGAVTYRDLLEHLLSPGLDPDDITVGEITDEAIILVRPTTSLSDAAEIMLEDDRTTLPVVDDDLVGYISFTDILRVIHLAKPRAQREQSFDPAHYII
ncbi:CBS domain-containing protein [Candidatus Bathyarchaeota archaeon]|jgi:CBS domain-containing protein|nr:CBS domain-containing protein [Candidatus Bathyarchaeota archaeon]